MPDDAYPSIFGEHSDMLSLLEVVVAVEVSWMI